MLKKIFSSILILTLMLATTSAVFAGKGGGNGGGGGGGGHGGGGGGEVPDTGTLYGDLYVILRDVNGVPIFHTETITVPESEEGPGDDVVVTCLQPISAVTASVTIATYDDGSLTIDAIEGEPFALPSYVDPAGDLVECELTEMMADWVQSVDFGRLNMGRAPVSVIAHAFDEAINKMNTATAISLDPAGRLVLTFADDSVKTIDAPAENLALYIAMMTDGDWITEDTTPIVNGGPPDGVGPAEGDGPSSEPRPVLNEIAIGHLEGLGFTNLGDPYDGTIGADLNNQELLLAASLLAAAADKTGSITLDKVVYINFIYGINQLGTLSDGQPEPRNYFDYGGFGYDRGLAYQNRGSTECSGYGSSFVWVLQPEVVVDNHFVITCMDLLAYAVDPEGIYDQGNSVRYTYMTESYTTVPFSYTFDTNVRGFAQAADDALQIIEYIHNYKLPEDLYAE